MTYIDLPERYAQRAAGRKMHLVTDYGADRVASVARCGVRPIGNWRMTSNVPWAHGCRNCNRCRPRTRVQVQR